VNARIRTQALLVGVVPLAFLILLLALGLMMQLSTQWGSNLEQRTQLALTYVDKIRVQLEQAGRAVTGTAKGSAQRLATIRSNVEGDLRLMRPLVAGDRAVAVRVDRLATQVHAAMDLFDHYAAAVRKKQTAKARAMASAPSTRKLSANLSSSYEDLLTRARVDELTQIAALRDRVHIIEIALITACAIGIILTLLVSARFGLTIAQRLASLAENARRLARGEAAAPLRGNDEFADLDVVYQAMMRQIAREQQLNSRLQGMLLPQKLATFDGVRIDTSYVPAAQESAVGGDWYDAFAIGDHCICISMGDVAGHGLRAASVMASARLAVRTAARMQSDPGQIAAHLNRVISADEPDTLVTAVVALLDINDGTLRYAVAGHPEPMLIHANGETELLSGKGLVLGAEPDAAYETFQTRLYEGSALLLYTDGLIEVSRDYFAGVEQLRKAASAEFASSAHNIAEAIQQRIFRGERADDDAALMFVCITRLGSAIADPRRH
jgi:serine phosphatase RsbU (regulator of sigma subunit)